MQTTTNSLNSLRGSTGVTRIMRMNKATSIKDTGRRLVRQWLRGGVLSGQYTSLQLLGPIFL
ncbi:MAG: hypothetical protein V4454_20135 [Pseudomonadota bacterium]